MNTKHISLALAVLTLAALLAGCTKNTIEKQQANLELSNVSTNETKAVIDGTIFPKDGHIGLFLFEDEEAVTPYGDINCLNVEYSYDETTGKWIASTPIMVGDEPGYLYGYYPYDSEVESIKDIPVKSSLDGDDVMYATKQTITDETASQTSITMNHALARISLKVVNNGYTLGEAKLSSIRFAGAEVAESGSLDATSGIISGTTKADVTLEVPSGKQTITAEGTVYECLLVPSKVEPLKQTLDLTMKIDGNDKSVTLSGETGMVIAQNTRSNVTINLSNSGISVQTVSIEDWNVVEVGGHKFTLKLSDDTGIADDLIVQCKPNGNSVKVEVCSKDTIPVIIRIGDGTRIAPVENGNISAFTISDIASDITATLAYAKKFTVTGRLVLDVIPEDGYFDNIRLEGLGDIFEGRTRTVKVGTVPGYYTKMVCDGKTVSGGVIVLEDVSKDLEVSALYEFYDYPLPGVFTVADDGKGNVRKVKFARGNMWCQNGVLHNEEEQYQFSREKWEELGHLSHFLWCRSLEESVKEKYRESRTTANDNFFTNTGRDHLSPNPNLVVNGQKGKWRVLSGSENGEWDYLLKKRTTTYGHRYAKVKVNGIPGLLIFPDEFTWPSGAGNEPAIFDDAAKVVDWKEVNNYQGAAFLALQADGCVFLPAAGQWDRYADIFDDDTGLYWSSTPSGSEAAYYQRFIPWKVYQDRIYRHYACTVRLVTDVE